MGNLMRKLTRVAMLCSASGLSCAACAQTASNAAEGATDNPGLQDIVVTARRTEESLQTTPVAVTAVNEQALRRAQVIDVTGLQRTAPSLSVATGAPAASGIVFLSIRGAGNLQTGVANDPAVGIYVDGVYIARASQGLTDLIDIQRAEVLRGPQGTLFGRNTTGGALNIITANPTGDLSVKARAEIGNYNYRLGNAVVNVPLAGDELAFRAVYNFREHDGYGRNLAADRDAADIQSHFVRAKLRYAPTGSDWDVTLSGDYNKLKDSGQLTTLSAVDPAGIAASALGYATLAPFLRTPDTFYITNGTAFVNDPKSRVPRDSLEAYGGSATINGKIGELNIRSITAYRYSNSVGTTDLDATPLPLLATESGYLSKAFSQELQVYGNVGDRFNYIIGAYYSHEKGKEFSDAQAFGFLNGVLPGQGLIFRNDADVVNKSTGLFAQANYKLTDRLRFTAGLRWTWDTRGVVLHNVRDSFSPRDAIIPTLDLATGTVLFPVNCISFPAGGNPADCNDPRRAKFNYPAWTADLDWRANDNVFIYLKTSGASKAGGINLRQFSPVEFDPEDVRDVEGGLKLESDDKRLRANVAVFYSWQLGVQRNVSAVINGVSTQFTQNSGDARVYGSEFEVAAVPWEGMEINTNLSLLSGNYKRGSFVIGGVDQSSQPLPQLPKTQFNFAATQTLPTSFGSVSIHGEYAYIGAQSYAPVTAPPGASAATQAVFAEQNRLQKTPSYGLINGRISLHLDKPDIDIALFGRNLTKKKYSVHNTADFYTSFGYSLDYTGDPRTYGVSVAVAFGPH